MSDKQLVSLKPEVVRVLEREKSVCDVAIARLTEKYRPLEQEYGWTTDEFVEKFDAGEIGDKQEYFLWHALAEASKDWQITRESLEELLLDSEMVSA
ncbi:MAG: hypothetical protein U9Q82_04705 [Chloroflexota bacterium]|nr:hypothetical protein [Chloroflexota bacterium]